MTEPWNHISPRFTNVPWADHHGRLTRLRRGDDGSITATTSGPTNWGAERGLYPPEIEEALSRMESLVAPIYRLLLEGTTLSVNERHIWSHWLICQFVRTPSILLDIAGIPEQVLGRLRIDKSLSPFPSTERAISSAIEGILRSTVSMRFIPFLVLRDWAIYRAPEGISFIKGDNPVIIEGHLAQDDARIVYPVSPQLCFEAGIVGRFPPTQLQVELSITPEQVREINRLIAYRAEREAICRFGDASDELRADIAEHLGKGGPFLQVGIPPDLQP